MTKNITLPCNVGDKIYIIYCDSEGNPDSEIIEEYICYFYTDGKTEGIGISTDYYDGHTGYYVKDGEIVNGILRMFLNYENAISYLEKM